jgi:GH15 family glucan-1,4-alpha-glucosidase
MEEGQAFVDWLIHTTRLTAPELQVMYDLYGNTWLKERELKHLCGYRGSRPVRIGNDASDQLQLDIYGSVTLAAYDLLQRGVRLEKSELRLLAGFGEVVMRRWQEPDEGIWEYRDGRRHNTYSKVMCWAVLDRLIQLQDRGQVEIDRERLVRGREAIARSIEAHAYNEAIGGYASAYGGTTVDASLLLLARCRYVAPRAPKMRGTYDCLEHQVGHNGLLYRYPRGFDGLDEPEGTFAACSFWATEYLARRGDVDAARDKLDRLLGFANDVGLFSEEIDAETGRALGNFPQAFSHSGLINAAIAIQAAERAEGGSAQRSAERGRAAGSPESGRAAESTNRGRAASREESGRAAGGTSCA